MSDSKHLRSSDYRAMLALMGELGELAAENPVGAIEHLLLRVGERLNAASSVIVLDYPQGFAAKSPPPWQVNHVLLHGLDDWQQRFWNAWFIERKGQFEHPLFLASVEHAGRRRSNGREALVPDSAWYSNEFVNDCLRQVGFDDSISSTMPLDDRSEFIVAAARPWGDARLSHRDLRWLDTFSENLEWLFYRYRRACVAKEAPMATAQPRLPPRLRETLDLLLGDSSEQQIAAAMNLTQRSAHKYVERVYRAFEVHSRAELMAIFIARDAAAAQPS